MIRLTQHNLPDYFSIADCHSSWHQTPVNTFNFADRDSDILIVTVGDSWTWGSDLAESNSDDAYRVQHLYGNLVTRELNTDWLNLGLSATSNFWLVGMVEELAQLIPQLNYQQIHVICVFTGVGRWFHTQYDRYIHYPSWVMNNVASAQDYNKLLLKFNQDCVDRIQAALAPYEHVQLKFGTNFVDPLGFDAVPPEQLLSVPWYTTMWCNDGLTSHVCMDGVKALLRMPEVVTDQQKLDYFKEWILEIIPTSEKRNHMLTNTEKFRNYHPLAQGHQQWAEYLLTQLRLK